MGKTKAAVVADPEEEDRTEGVCVCLWHQAHAVLHFCREPLAGAAQAASLQALFLWCSIKSQLLLVG